MRLIPKNPHCSLLNHCCFENPLLVSNQKMDPRVKPEDDDADNYQHFPLPCGFTEIVPDNYQHFPLPCGSFRGVVFPED